MEQVGGYYYRAFSKWGSRFGADRKNHRADRHPLGSRAFSSVLSVRSDQQSIVARIFEHDCKTARYAVKIFLIRGPI